MRCLGQGAASAHLTPIGKGHLRNSESAAAINPHLRPQKRLLMANPTRFLIGNGETDAPCDQHRSCPPLYLPRYRMWMLCCAHAFIALGTTSVYLVSARGHLWSQEHLPPVRTIDHPSAAVQAMRSLITASCRSGAFHAGTRTVAHQQLSSSASSAVYDSSHRSSTHVVRCRSDNVDIPICSVTRRDLIVVRPPRCSLQTSEFIWDALQGGLPQTSMQ